MEERKEGVGYRTVMETRKKRNFQEDREYGKRKSYEYKDIATFNQCVLLWSLLLYIMFYFSLVLLHRGRWLIGARDAKFRECTALQAWGPGPDGE